VSDSFQVDSAQLYRHASNVGAVRDRFTAIKNASQAIAQDDAAYGALCGWISAVLERRHVRQHQLYAYVDENLQLMTEALATTGGGYDAVDSTAQSRIRTAGGLG
jgi:hypothetical protein